jgi:hypothetical protein
LSIRPLILSCRADLILGVLPSLVGSSALASERSLMSRLPSIPREGVGGDLSRLLSG